MTEKEDICYLFKSLSTFTPTSGGHNSTALECSYIANNDASVVQNRITSVYNGTDLAGKVSPVGGYG